MVGVSYEHEITVTKGTVIEATKEVFKSDTVSKLSSVNVAASVSSTLSTTVETEAPLIPVGASATASVSVEASYENNWENSSETINSSSSAFLNSNSAETSTKLAFGGSDSITVLPGQCLYYDSGYKRAESICDVEYKFYCDGLFNQDLLELFHSVMDNVEVTEALYKVIHFKTTMRMSSDNTIGASVLETYSLGDQNDAWCKATYE